MRYTVYADEAKNRSLKVVFHAEEVKVQKMSAGGQVRSLKTPRGPRNGQSSVPR
jgi:hypothetical protein